MAIAPSQVRRLPGQGPITPEIAQAYTNDPRTQVARAAQQTGIDTSPVAQGEWAWADGLARAFTGGIGAYQDSRLRKQYGSQDDQMVSERAANAQRQLDQLEAERAAKLGGTPAPAMASAIAAKLGAPAPATPAVAPTAPMGGGAPVPPPPAPPPASMAPPMAPPPISGAMPGAPPRAPAPRPAGVAFTDPLAGRGRRTSGYGDTRPGGRQHRATDWAAEAGTPVAAAATGRVVRAWNDTANGGGNSVIIEHPDGSRTGYAHLQNFNVQRGDTVEAGQPIGAVGSTGRSSGAHLHFTYRDPSGQRRDPSSLQFGPVQAAEAAAAESGEPDPNATQVGDVEVVGVPGEAQDYGIPAETLPTAPVPVGATRSRGLTNGLELAAGGNPYESARAQGLITAGFDQQTELDEADAARRNDTNMIGYRAGLDRYGQDRNQIRGQRFDRRERLGRQEYGTDERVAGQEFQAGENNKQRQWGTQERLGGERFQAGENVLDRRQQRDITEMTIGSREEQARIRAQNTPAYIRANTAAGDAINANSDARERVNQFLALNREQGTGGIVQRYGPGGLDTFGNPRLQRMESLANGLTTAVSTQLKGALSDKDIEFLKKSGLSIANNPSANAATGAFMERALERGNEFQYERLEALQRNDTGFPRAWAAYREAVPLVGSNGQPVENTPTFQEWRAGLERVGY